MHSDMTRETGSTATETGRLRYCMRDDENLGLWRETEIGVPGACAAVVKTAESARAAGWSPASRLMLRLPVFLFGVLLGGVRGDSGGPRPR